jgi:ATP-dependent DNA helicase RecG
MAMSTSRHSGKRRQLELDFNAPLPTLPHLWTPDDIYNSCDEETVRRFSEDGRVERKQGTISQKLLSEYVVMWANTQPSGGVTFLGIGDKGTVIGCRSVEQSHLNDLEAVERFAPMHGLNLGAFRSLTGRGSMISSS